jgi:biofilm PGA synthesis lipoprotein PgaB
LGKTIFELQTVDWNRAGKDRAIPEDMLSAEMRLLTSEGALNLGYYPDDFMTDTPKLDLLRHDFSHPTDMTTP